MSEGTQPLPQIERMWRYGNEPNNIHYRLGSRPEGRHLIARRGDGLFEELDAHLAVKQ